MYREMDMAVLGGEGGGGEAEAALGERTLNRAER